MAQSKTFWVNALNVLVAVAIYYIAPGLFTPEVAVTWLSGIGIVNLVLRKLTKTEVTIA